MKFKWLNKQGVESDSGFIVQIISRFTAEYIEEANKILVNFEIDLSMAGKVSIIISKASFQYWSNGVYISDCDKETIIRNFSSAMNFQNVNVVVRG